MKIHSQHISSDDLVLKLPDIINMLVAQTRQFSCCPDVDTEGGWIISYPSEEVGE